MKIKAKSTMKKILGTKGKGSKNNHKATGNKMEIIRCVQKLVTSEINQVMEVKERGRH